MLRLLLLAAIAFPVVAFVGCGEAAQKGAPGEAAQATTVRTGSAASTAAVPDLVGLAEGEAARALDAVGLVANVRYVADVPRRGAVYRTVPAAGSDVPDRSVVLLFVSLPPRLPSPGQEQEMEMGPVAELITRRPDVFVGLYRDGAAVPHVVFGPGGEPEEWADRLQQAARGISYPVEGVGYRTDTCSRSHTSLRAVQDEITADQAWTENERLAFGVWVHPETCTVRVESDLLAPAEIEALVARYGTAISFDTTPGSHPELLSSAAR